MKYVITCPHCGLTMAWTPQPRKVVVKCPNREITVMTRDGRPQRWTQMYGTTDGSRCWVEDYYHDGPDRPPRWKCKRWFVVAALADKAGE